MKFDLLFEIVSCFKLRVPYLLQNDGLMTRRMAIDVHRNRQARDMAGEAFNMNCHGCYLTAEPFWTDARPVHGLEQRFFQACKFEF
jgi:hypothetical protein